MNLPVSKTELRHDKDCPIAEYSGILEIFLNSKPFVLLDIVRNVSLMSNHDSLWLQKDMISHKPLLQGISDLINKMRMFTSVPWPSLFTVDMSCSHSVQASLFNYKMTSIHINSGLALHTNDKIDASLFNDRWRLLTTLQSPFLKEKKGVRFRLEHQLMTPGTISSGLVPQPPSPTPNVPPIKNDWEITVVQEPVVFNRTRFITENLIKITPFTSTITNTQEEQSHVTPTSVEEDDYGIEVAHMDNDLISAGRYLLQAVRTRKLNSHERWNAKHVSRNAEKAGLSEGYGITPEVPDEPKDNSVVVAEKQAGYVQTNLTLSSAELEIQSIGRNFPFIRGPCCSNELHLIDPVDINGLKRTASTP
ncbi:hypothetical protein Tco_0429495 [Tanacetum coccineum]